MWWPFQPQIIYCGMIAKIAEVPMRVVVKIEISFGDCKLSPTGNTRPVSVRHSIVLGLGSTLYRGAVSVHLHAASSRTSSYHKRQLN